MAIGIAIIGAGTFARDGKSRHCSLHAASQPANPSVTEHLPAVKACSSFSLKAVYSRSEAAAKTFAGITGSPADIFYDVAASSASPSHNLDALLARTDIQALIIALPIDVQPPIIKKALEAGKHVLSGKPIAKDVKTANGLLSWYNAFKPKPKKPLWAVGENFRFMQSILFGAWKLTEIGGQVVAFNMTLYGFVDEDGKYNNAKWYPPLPLHLAPHPCVSPAIGRIAK